MPKGGESKPWDALNPQAWIGSLLPMDAFLSGSSPAAQDLGGRAAADLEKANADVESLVNVADDAARSTAQGGSEVAKARKTAAEKSAALKAAEAEAERLAAAKDETARALLDKSHSLAAAAGKALARTGDHEGKVEAAEARFNKAKELLAAAEKDAAALKAKADQLESRSARALPGDAGAMVEELEAAREAAAAAGRGAGKAKAIQEEAEQQIKEGGSLAAASKDEGPALSAKVRSCFPCLAQLSSPVHPGIYV